MNDDRVTAWYEAYGRELLLYIRKLTGGHSDADDIHAQVFLEAWRCADSLDDTPRPWLYAVARCRVIDWRRANNRRSPVPIEEAPPLVEGFEDRVIDRMDMAQAWYTAARLTDLQRRAIWRVYVEGYSAHEVAQWMGVSYVGLKALLHRGKVNLSQSFGSNSAPH